MVVPAALLRPFVFSVCSVEIHLRIALFLPRVSPRPPWKLFVRNSLHKGHGDRTSERESGKDHVRFLVSEPLCTSVSSVELPTFPHAP